MITIEKTLVSGWDAALRGMRNPLNSWNMSDTVWNEDGTPAIGKRDMDLMERLVKAGSDHRKFLRYITVTADITAPRYWWPEWSTYKVGTVENSCSTMHKIHARDFIREDFSCEHLLGKHAWGKNPEDIYVDGKTEKWTASVLLNHTINMLNHYRALYMKTKDKTYWWQMIQLLPQSYNQKRTVMLNYEVLRNMYHARKNHKLDEWHTFCRWVEDLPYADHLITGKEDAG
jgi:hypothetical protein